MNHQELLERYDALPDSAQRKVNDLIATLYRQQAESAENPASVASLADDPVVGMWSDREDMADSTAYVRQLRESQWNRQAR